MSSLVVCNSDTGSTVTLHKVHDSTTKEARNILSFASKSMTALRAQCPPLSDLHGRVERLRPGYVIYDEGAKCPLEVHLRKSVLVFVRWRWQYSSSSLLTSFKYLRCHHAKRVRWHRSRFSSAPRIRCRSRCRFGHECGERSRQCWCARLSCLVRDVDDHQMAFVRADLPKRETCCHSPCLVCLTDLVPRYPTAAPVRKPSPSCHHCCCLRCSPGQLPSGKSLRQLLAGVSVQTHGLRICRVR